MRSFTRQLLLGIALLSVLYTVSAEQADDILGDWATAGGLSRVTIFKREGRYHGRISKLKQPAFQAPTATAQLDSNNPDAALRTRTLEGLQIMQDFHFDNGRWRGGKIYDPQSGKTYQCELYFDAQGRLNVRGYVGLALLGRSTQWEPFEQYRQRELSFLGVDQAQTGRSE